MENPAHCPSQCFTKYTTRRTNQQHISSIIDTRTDLKIHSTTFIPMASTYIDAIDKGFLQYWPGLTSKIVSTIF